jgi:hypothetical protein
MVLTRERKPFTAGFSCPAVSAIGSIISSSAFFLRSAIDTLTLNLQI